MPRAAGTYVHLTAARGFVLGRRRLGSPGEWMVRACVRGDEGRVLALGFNPYAAKAAFGIPERMSAFSWRFIARGMAVRGGTPSYARAARDFGLSVRMVQGETSPQATCQDSYARALHNFLRRTRCASGELTRFVSTRSTSSPRRSALTLCLPTSDSHCLASATHSPSPSPILSIACH
ncbi:hypothetical protein C8F04DRAFT_1267027 [Mycena alexandri]|uniref:Uncharacterized protein n=1 Tax=Mycena alexandri TaxID=1745969 RepID=A0AAD6WW44_9AGAR|nr:hypothetical protein C8F04DRAFT_1267027 [Mycena alexandri]